MLRGTITRRILYVFHEDIKDAGAQKIRPKHLAVGFATYFLLIIYLGWETARWTTVPWYDQASTQIIYQTNLVAGALLLAGLLVVSATAGRKSIVTQGARMNPEGSYGSEGESRPSAEAGPGNPELSVEVSDELKSDIQWLDQEMENEFKSLFQILEEPESKEVMSHAPGSPILRLVTVSDPSTFVAVVGPAILAMSYLAVSAIFLPGAGSFLTTNFQLNTAAILALSYGWPGLGMYAILSVYLALRPAWEERRTK